MSRSTKIKIPILAIALIIQCSMAISLVISGIARTFPDASASTVQLVYTIMTLVALPTNLLVGKMATFITKKRLTIVACLLRIAGGLVGFFLGGSLAMLFLASILIGLGNGMAIPLCNALVAEHFEGQERATVVGLVSIFTSVGAVLISMAGGYLAARYWRAPYLVMLIIVPVMLLVMFLLPEGKIEASADGKKVKVFTPQLLMIVLQGMLFGLCWMTYLTNATMYVYSLGIGNESQAGLLNTIYSAGSVVMGLILARVMQWTGKYCFSAASMLAAAALWLFAFGNSFPVLVLGSICMGLGFGLFMPSGYTLIPNYVNPAAITMGISIFAALFSLGGFLNPYIITAGAGLINDGISTRFMVAAVIQTANLIFGLVVTKQLSDGQVKSE